MRAARPAEPAPVPERVGGHLRAVVAPDEPGRRPALDDKAVEHLDGLVGVDAAVALDRQRFTRELVHHVQQLEVVPVGGLIPLKVDRPHMIGPLSPQPLGRDGQLAQPLAFAALGRHSEALLAPHPPGALDVQRPPVLQQQRVRAPVPPPRALPRDPSQLRLQRRVIVGDRGLVALGGAMLPRQPARPTLRHPQPLLQSNDRATSTRRAQKFPADSSLSP